MGNVRLLFLLALFLSSCADRDTTEDEPTGTTFGVFMASQERNVHYVDSVPALKDDVGMFLMQAVDEPYYDTIYNSSSLVIRIGDSIAIYSFPVAVSGYLKDSAGSAFLMVPEFNDLYRYEETNDSVILQQKATKDQRNTYFHAVPATAGEAGTASLNSTTWAIDNPVIERITFQSGGSCVMRIKHPEGYAVIGSGNWSLKEIEGRQFLNFYSRDTYLKKPVFQTHYISNVDSDRMASLYYAEPSSPEKPAERIRNTWSQVNTEENAAITTGMAGTWISRDYPFSLTDNKVDYDTLQNTTTTLTLMENGDYSQEITGQVVTGSGSRSFSRKESGQWSIHTGCMYLSLEPGDGRTITMAISDREENNVHLNMPISGFSDEGQSAIKLMSFTKRTGT